MKCSLCPRECGASRTPEDPGYCKSPWHLTAARASMHMWEEPVISGVLGSGTVFFSGCGLGCVFCQNRSIALGETAQEITTEQLVKIFLRLQERGAHNINLVTGSHYVPQIAKALRLAKAQGLTIPVVYNTGSYEKVKTLQLLDGLVDIYLPDLKYADPRLAKRYANAPDYYETAMAAIQEMLRQVGDPEFEELDVPALLKQAKENGQDVTDYYKEDPDEADPEEDTAADPEENAGRYPESENETPVNEAEEEDPPLIMKKGVIVRHLMLPGALEDSFRIVEGLYDTFGDHIYISLMNQYTPCNALPDYPELQNTVDPDDYEALVDYAINIGVENGFIQEGETNKESFIPAFDYSGLE